MTEFQTWAVDRAGALVHAGPHKVERFGPSTARRLLREWEAWADGIAAEVPDCPTAQSRRVAVALIAHPVGQRELAKRYEARKGAGQK
jgi:hypothetical protein